jgi:hypothetical protein
LNINIQDLPFPLKYFPKLKSIIISSSFHLSDKHLKLILGNEQFKNLETLKIKQNFIFSNEFYDEYLIKSDYIFKKVFNQKNSLRTFQHLYRIPSFGVTYTNRFKRNSNLHSLTIVISDFIDMFTLLKYTPNLKYLNIRSEQPNGDAILFKKIDVKLEELYLTLKRTNEYGIDFDQLINGIKQFSSSLICLSLNLVDLYIHNRNEIPFNSTKFQQFLQSMTELKQFHLYAKLGSSGMTNDMILSQFKYQYWFDHNLSFGMHSDYFYTLPFHFDHLYEFPQDFDTAKSNNPEILINNSRIWYNVKSIELLRTSEFDRNFVKELQIKMPKLNLIKFLDTSYDLKHKTEISSEINDQQDKITVTLDNVTTIQFGLGTVDNEREWLADVTPNIKRLILSNVNFDLISNKLEKILDKKIVQLDIDVDCDLINLSEKNYVYFSNVKYINFCLDPVYNLSEWYAKIIMKILKNFQNFKILCIYRRLPNYIHKLAVIEARLNIFIDYLDMKKIMINYEMKRYQEYCLFLKREFNDDRTQEPTSFTLRSFVFPNRIRFS